MELLANNLCCGCGSCAAICPQNCIQMVSNDRGFLFPKVDGSMCMDCGVCQRACPVLQPAAFRKHDISPTAFAAVHRESDIRKSSSSGGVFSAIASAVLRMDGVVFGAAFDENMDVRHICIQSIKELPKLRGSKYVQSETGNCYKQAQAFLKCGKIVLFSGTPCQINGLYTFLGKTYDNLFTVDIACHGVPSPAVWKSYRAYLETCYDSRIRSVDFRNKTAGWRHYSFETRFHNGQKYCVEHLKDSYFKTFLGNYDLRESCYGCRFKAGTVSADVTLADFWGIWHFEIDKKDDLGTSLCIVNTLQGEKLLELSKEKLELSQVDLQKASAYNSSLVHSVERPKATDRFWELYHEKPIEECMETILRADDQGIAQRIKRKLGKIFLSLH